MKGSRLCKNGQHRDVFLRQCGRWLETEPDAPVLLVGMVGNREGWLEALYAIYPAGSAEIAQALVPADLENGPQRLNHPPACSASPLPVPPTTVRGEETPASGAGIENGLICSAGTHPKWIEMKNGRIERFATYMIGEMYGLLRAIHGRTGSPTRVQ